MANVITSTKLKTKLKMGEVNFDPAGPYSIPIYSKLIYPKSANVVSNSRLRKK